METADMKLLLDTGQTDAFISNAQALGIDLSSLDAVVLSHGHYDHGGGLKDLYDRLSTFPPPLFVGRGFDAPRRARNGERLTDIGLPSMVLPEHSPAPILIDTFEKLSISAHILSPVEKIDGVEAFARFRIIQGGREKLDNFDDELSLVFDEKDGIVIVTACAHRGILNIAHAAIQAFPGKPIKALVGGFHLVDVPDEELAKIAETIALLEPQAVFCAHCTGPRGFSALLNILPGRVTWLSCGMSISI
jgi:7,8-dihydropterin-6-yl-methyl-4-(beta-D-ribofuranosyl)aminobenzene 5'-phosphate synthase